MFADSIGLLCTLFVAGMAAGLVDSITGGGGLIALPVLLATGMPPHLAMGTNMFQSSFGSLAAAYIYISKGSVQLREVRLGVGFTFLGSAAGAMMVRDVDARALNVLLPIVVFAVFIYTVLAYPVLTVDARPRVQQRLFYGLVGSALGFYDGFIGAGAGSLWAMAFVIGLGFNLAKATAYTKPVNLTSNVTAFLLFLTNGSVWLAGGASMAAGQLLGATVGAGLVVKKGARFVRPFYIAVVMLLLLKLAYNLSP